MNSGRGRKTLVAGPSNSMLKSKGVGPHYGHPSGDSGASNTNIKVGQLSRDVGNMSLDSTQDADWEVFMNKAKNQTGGNAAKEWGNQGSTPNADWEVFMNKAKNQTGGNAAKEWGNQGSTPNAWGLPNAWAQPSVSQKLGMSNNGAIGKPTGFSQQRQTIDVKGTNGRGTVNVQQYNRNLDAPPNVLAPPLQHGWQWGARAGSAPVNLERHSGEDSGSDVGGRQNQNDTDEDDDDLVEDDDDDDDLMSDDFDSDNSVKSHETRKKHKWFKSFFEVLDKLTIEQLNEPSRQWHCPACRNGPGAIDWFKGLQPLMAHAKTKGAKRVKLHRELAEVLDEELRRRGTSVVPIGEVFGKWEGLHGKVSDREIVWPPMIVVMNTQHEMDEYDQKWLGMGNQELLDYFSSYKALKARHSYGPKGHRGMSLLIFESSAMGRLEAERLHKHFVEQGTDQHAWDTKRVLFCPGGKRQLYGYLARREDLDNFNKHCPGKTKVKFEMRSYEEVFLLPLQQMSEDNQQLVYLKNKLSREQQLAKALEESFDLVTQKLRKTTEENRIVRQRTKMQHEQNKEEMDFQEQFFKDQINVIHEALEKKERDFEALLQEEREKVKKSTADSGVGEDAKLRSKEVAEFIELQVKGIEEFEAEREKLIKLHEDEKAEMKRRHMEEEIQIEKNLEGSLTRLMEKYAPRSSE